MKKYIAIFMSILVMMVSVFAAPAGVIAEDIEEDKVTLVERKSFKTEISCSHEVRHDININLYIYSDGHVNIETHSSVGDDLSSSKHQYVYTIKFNTDYNYNGETTEIFLSEYEGINHLISETRTIYHPTKYYMVEYTPVSAPATQIDFIVGDETFTYSFSDRTENDNTNGQIFGDIDGDGLINASDASLILLYSAYRGAGGDLSFKEWLAQ